MLVLGHLLDAISVVVHYALTIFMWIVIARAVLSWVSPDPFNPIVRFIHNVTEPVLHQIRHRLPIGFGGVDFSPIIVLLGIVFLQRFVVGSLQGMAAALLAG
jgi:YggT family protein